MRALVFFVFTFLALPQISSAEEKDLNRFVAKVAVVDIEAILEHSMAIKHIKSSISEISNQIQNNLTQQEIELKRIEEELVKQRGIIVEAEFNNKVNEFNKKVTAAQQEVQKQKTALEHAHSEAIAQIHKSVTTIIKNLTKKHDFNLVLFGSQVLFAESKLNITDEIIENLNQILPTVELNYK